MTTQPQTSSPAPKLLARLVRELVGVALVLAGAVAVDVAAWFAAFPAGLAVTGGIFIAAGVALTVERS